jgi:hypothetical protein
MPYRSQDEHALRWQHEDEARRAKVGDKLFDGSIVRAIYRTNREAREEAWRLAEKALNIGGFGTLMTRDGRWLTIEFPRMK